MMIERANAGLHDFVFQVLQQKGLVKAGMSILDIGAGSGAWLKRFKDNQAGTLVGVDLDTHQFSLVGAEAHAMNLDVYNGETWGTFDMVTSLELIEHLESPGNLFKLVDKNLSSNGVWVISTPNIHSINARLRFLLKGRLGHFDDQSDPTHIYPVYTENIERILSRYQMHIVETVSFPQEGTFNYSKGITTIASIASLFVPKSTPGDNIIYLIKRK